MYGDRLRARLAVGDVHPRRRPFVQSRDSRCDLMTSPGH